MIVGDHLPALREHAAESRPLRARASPRPAVLTLLGALWPGHEANGPNQSLTAMCRALSDAFDFSIVARDRGREPGAAALAEAGRWVEADFARLIYCEAHGKRVSGLRRVLAQTPHDLLLLNSFFDPHFTIAVLAMRRLGLVPSRPTILSPRGEFSPGALGIKAGKKQAYLTMARAFGLLDGVIFHATGERERDEIAAALPWISDIRIAANIRTPPAPPPAPRSIAPGVARLLFLSRIDRKKNLDYALKVLARARAKVVFDIYGPKVDPAYWAECEALIADLPEHVTARWRGPLAHRDVHDTFGAYDALFLPTRGENFGHAIVDALAAGCPVLISDQTPWLDLEARAAGWSPPLDAPERFVQAIEALAAMDIDARGVLRAGARRFADSIVGDADAVEATRAMLQAVASGAAPVVWSEPSATRGRP